MQETFVFFSMDPCTQFDWSTSCLNFLQSNWFQGSRCWADWRIIENKTNLKKENTDMISSSCLLVVGVHLFYVPFVFFNLIGHCLNIKWIKKSVQLAMIGLQSYDDTIRLFKLDLQHLSDIFSGSFSVFFSFAWSSLTSF